MTLFPAHSGLMVRNMRPHEIFGCWMGKAKWEPLSGKPLLRPGKFLRVWRKIVDNVGASEFVWALRLEVNKLMVWGRLCLPRVA